MVWWLSDRYDIVLMMSKESHEDAHETYIWWLHVKEKHKQHEICNAFLGTGDSAVVVGYGHLGDGNLHLNVSAPKYDDKV